jgi:hypothetical protein
MRVTRKEQFEIVRSGSTDPDLNRFDISGILETNGVMDMRSISVYRST